MTGLNTNYKRIYRAIHIAAVTGNPSRIRRAERIAHQEGWTNASWVYWAIRQRYMRLPEAARPRRLAMI